MVPRFICASNATERICLMNIVPTSRATTSSSAVPTRAHSVSNFRTARRVFEGRIKTERQRTRGRLNSRTNASRQVCMAAYSEDEDLYSVLGVPKDADAKTLKQAYRKLALKYHPDVNKEPDANERFVRIKQAYSTLSDSTARGEYDRQQARKDYSGSGSSSSTSAGFGGGFDFGGFGTSPDDEPFYGIDDFFRDMEKDWKEAAKDGKTKSLWDELNELGEEFVEFLEESVEDTISAMAEETDWDEVFEKEMPKKGNAADKPPEQSLEEMLAQLKKDMGL